MIKKRKIILSLIISIILILKVNTIYAGNISSDINSIDEAKYPGIKVLIQNLQKAHPSWKFQIEYTGLDFNDVVMNECQGHGKSPRNLSPANNTKYAGMWICPICGTKVYDSENWYCASETAIKYMMDPRNSVNESDIFQFMDLSYIDNSTVSSTTDLKIEATNLEIVPSINYAIIKEKYPNSIIKKADGTEIKEGNIPTSSKITIDNKTYTVITKGDVTKDGMVNIIDVVTILNNITGKKELDSDAKMAGKLQGSGEPSIIDVVNILNYITGKKDISISVSGEESNLANCVRNSASAVSYLDDECINAILNASNTYKVNPLYLLARITQEQGSGTSPLVTGQGQDGNYVGIYNLFNINAFGNNKQTIIKNGLSYANSQGWNSKAASITGGVKIIAEGYIGKKQNTLYYQKFNVVGTEKLYSHQYMQNILAAQSEGTTLRKTYISMDSNLKNTYVFTIPLYENMPKEVCSRPDTTKNNIKTEYEEKKVSVNSNLIVRTSPSTKASKITTLENGATVKVINTVDEKIDNHYWSLIVCEATGAYGYVATDYIK